MASITNTDPNKVRSTSPAAKAVRSVVRTRTATTAERKSTRTKARHEGLYPRSARKETNIKGLHPKETPRVKRMASSMGPLEKRARAQLGGMAVAGDPKAKAKKIKMESVMRGKGTGTESASGGAAPKTTASRIARKIGGRALGVVGGITDIKSARAIGKEGGSFTSGLAKFVEQKMGVPRGTAGGGPTKAEVKKRWST